MNDLFADTEPRKIARTDGPQTSKDAAAIAPTGKMREFVFNLIALSGRDGVTIKEMTRANSHIQSSSITSRPNELIKLGLVFLRGDRRDGSGILRESKYDTKYRLCGKCNGALLEVYNRECQRCK